ncbi:MAG TPA: hypothetical protein PK504_08490 [Ferruginibacter sp.]|nr:hypothetical protein [Ferruginibacter sp.]HRE64428.1 hypothetical protein [Ferruginibacter sp.]
MRIKKEILLFYVLIIASAGVIIAADQPDIAPKKPVTNPDKPVKCCNIKKQPTTPTPNYITEGMLRLKA